MWRAKGYTTVFPVEELLPSFEFQKTLVPIVSEDVGDHEARGREAEDSGDEALDLLCEV